MSDRLLTGLTILSALGCSVVGGVFFAFLGFGQGGGSRPTMMSTMSAL